MSLDVTRILLMLIVNYLIHLVCHLLILAKKIWIVSTIIDAVADLINLL